MPIFAGHQLHEGRSYIPPDISPKPVLDIPVLDYKLSNNFSLFLNGYSDVITAVPSGFAAYFNTPKYRLNTGVANSGFGKKGRFGFNANLRWQDAFQWKGELAMVQFTHTLPLMSRSVTNCQRSIR